MSSSQDRTVLAVRPSTGASSSRSWMVIADDGGAVEPAAGPAAGTELLGQVDDAIPGVAVEPSRG